MGFELRNLLANVDLLLPTLAEDAHWSIGVAQKKLTTNMNNLVESMKKAIMHSDTPMEGTVCIQNLKKTITNKPPSLGAYKQNMLESAYILVIDSKNLLDTIDDIRMNNLNYFDDSVHDDGSGNDTASQSTNTEQHYANHTEH